MNVRFKGLLMFTALVAPAGLALAQTAAPVANPPVAAQPKPQPAQPGPQTMTADPAATVAPAPVPAPPPPPPVWTMADANQLLMSILNASKEGLDPRDYDSAGLITAMRPLSPRCSATSSPM